MPVVVPDEAALPGRLIGQKTATTSTKAKGQKGMGDGNGQWRRLPAEDVG